MKSCGVCGSRARDADRVCTNCGAPFGEGTVRESARIVQLREHREREEARRYWQAQRRQAQARRQRATFEGVWRQAPATIVLIALTAVVSLVGMFGLLPSIPGPLGYLVMLFLNPGLLSLLFGLFFLWAIGSMFEAEVPLALYLLVFFGSGFIGQLVEVLLGALPVGLFAALWGMAGGLWAWSRGHRMGAYALQWIYGAIIGTVVLNIFMLNFNIGPLIVQIVVAIGAGAGIVYLWDLAQEASRRH